MKFIVTIIIYICQQNEKNRRKKLVTNEREQAENMTDSIFQLLFLGLRLEHVQHRILCV